MTLASKRRHSQIQQPIANQTTTTIEQVLLLQGIVSICKFQLFHRLSERRNIEIDEGGKLYLAMDLEYGWTDGTLA